MGKAAAGTPKHLANAMKSKGLQKLIYYCQVCQKQCRDANGYKCHTESEGHLRAMLVVGESAGKYISNYSSQFQSEFVAMLSRRWGTKRVLTNLVYQEFISDKNHLHMNATRWMSLTEFTKHLGRCGIAKVDETEKGWFITWIDNSPKALSKAREGEKKEKGDEGDEMRERRMIDSQISRARREGERRKVEADGGIWTGETDETVAATVAASELVRAEGEKVSLSLAFKIDPIQTTSTSLPIKSQSIDSPITIAPTSFSMKPTITPTFKPSTNAFKPKSNPLKSNPLKAKASSSTPAQPSMGPQKRALSNVEMVMQEELIRKNRQGGSDKRTKFEFRG